MLGKLFKYDFKWINKTMPIYFLVGGILAIFIRIVECFEMTTIVTIIDKILVSMFISSLFSIGITYLIRIWARFKDNLYKDESYLTHTLPAKKSTIYTSKVLASLLTVTIMIFGIVALLLAAILRSETVDYLKNLIDGLKEMFGDTGFIGILILGIVLIILEFFSMIQSGFLGIVIGHKANNKKMIKSFFVGLMLYGFISAASLIILFIISKFNSNINELFVSNIPSVETIKISFIVGFLIYLGFNIVYYLLGKKLFEKGVNVD